ncbi:sigma-E factor negative regulatory protein, partial [Rhodanobacter denitrificans]|nr:sigma-E factor negative regulatory protein [Rhodanobacter denitrificans]
MNQAGMNQDTREGLSAGIDGELSKEQLRFLLRRLEHDASLQQAWTRYHIARDGLRRQLPSMAQPGFAARVMLAIEQESK